MDMYLRINVHGEVCICVVGQGSKEQRLRAVPLENYACYLYEPGHITLIQHPHRASGR